MKTLCLALLLIASSAFCVGMFGQLKRFGDTE